jgi:N-formylglutamate deformylase
MHVSAYHLSLPRRRTTSVVFASPHSGRDYPAEFLQATILDERAIRSSEDAFIDELLAGVPGFGAPLIAARAPRAYLDLNRGADELDPAVVEGAQSYAHNPRVVSGLGVIPRVVSGGRAIYSGKIGLAEARARLSAFWFPYHQKLQELLDESRAMFGQAVLIDVHSMPHEAMDSVAHRSGRRPQIVVGDRYGAAAAAEVTDRVEQAFRDRGYQVARNAPFAGAYIAQTYGRPGIRQHAVQIEMDRALYMDERRIRPHDRFAAFKDDLTEIMAEVAEIGRDRAALAAE